jgi:hypothetical protein
MLHTERDNVEVPLLQKSRQQRFTERTRLVRDDQTRLDERGSTDPTHLCLANSPTNL